MLRSIYIIECSDLYKPWNARIQFSVDYSSDMSQKSVKKMQHCAADKYLFCEQRFFRVFDNLFLCFLVHTLSSKTYGGHIF